MDTKVKGIVIKLIEYKDADKLAQIFSLEQGIISAKFQGVKKEKAKFKAVAQPFIFADFVLSEKGEHKTVTSVDIIDGFAGLLYDYSRTMAGYVVLDMIRRIIPEMKPEPDLFLLTLSGLKKIEQEEANSALIDYIIKFIELSGMAIDFPHANYVYLDQLSGNFSISRTPNSIAIDKKVYSYLYHIYISGAGVNIKEEKNQILNVENTNLNDNQKDNFSQTTIKQAIRLMRNIIYLKFNVDVKAFDFI